jgi:hypothetical protein
MQSGGDLRHAKGMVKLVICLTYSNVSHFSNLKFFNVLFVMSFYLVEVLLHSVDSI